MFNVLKMMVTVCLCVSVCVLEYMFTSHTLSQWIFPSFVFPLSCFSSWTFLLISSSPLHLHDSFLVFLYSFPTLQNLFSVSVWFSARCLLCCLIQSRSDRKITNTVFSFEKQTLPSPFSSFYLRHGWQV